MRLKIDSRVTIYEPNAAIENWVKQCLTFVNPDYAKKERMGLWTGNTPRNIKMYEKLSSGALRVPYGCLNKVISLCPYNTEIKLDFAPTQKVNYNAKVNLYDYQKQAVDYLKTAYYGILEAPPGSGKTQIGIALICELGLKALWITHTKDLLLQSKHRAEQYIDCSLIGTITEGQVDIGTGITFATVQTLANLDLPTYKNEWNIVIVDECHNVAGSPTNVTRYSRVLSYLSPMYKYGLSATVHRSDGLIACTKALLGEVVYEITKEDVGEKIMKVGICPIDTKIEAPLSVYKADGTIDHAKMITWLSENEERNQLIIDTLMSEPIVSTIILTDRKEHSKRLMEMLPDNILDLAVTINGDSRKTTRERAVEDMKSGKKKILIATFSLAKEGLDIPCLEREYLVSPHRDYAVISQAIGRVARAYPGKEKAIVYDFVDVPTKHLYRDYRKRITTYKKNKCYWIVNDSSS